MRHWTADAISASRLQFTPKIRHEAAAEAPNALEASVGYLTGETPAASYEPQTGLARRLGYRPWSAPDGAADAQPMNGMPIRRT